jgi:site-specific recombinase XerD
LYTTMASLFKRKNKFYLSFYSPERYPTRKQVNLRTNSKRAAERLRIKLEDMWALEEYDPWIEQSWHSHKQEPMEIQQAVAQFIASQEHVRKQTTQKYKSVLGQFSMFVGHRVLLSRVSSAQVYKFLHSTDRAAITKKTYSTTLSPFFEWAIKQKYIGHNPTKHLKLERPPNKFPRYLSVRDVETVCEVIRANISDIARLNGNADWLVPIVKVATLSGMRIGELTNLKWTHVNLEAQIISLQQEDNFETKSGKDRLIPISSDCNKVLSSLPQTCPWVFASYSGKRLCPRYVSRRFKHHCNLVEIDANFHTLRHTAASWLIQAGCSLEAVRQLLGHSSIRVTERYVHLKPSAFSSEIRSLQESYLSERRGKSGRST